MAAVHAQSAGCRGGHSTKRQEEDVLSSPLRPRPQILPFDYKFRPSQLESFPLYFFLSACDVSKHLNEGSMDWVTLGAQRQRSYATQPLTSKHIPELPLLDAHGKPLHGYDFYVHLRTREPWRIPLLFGRLPRSPDASSENSDKGQYAFLMMLLFRAHRETSDIVQAVFSHDAAPFNTSSTDMNERWRLLFQEFERWRSEEIDSVAAPYFQRHRSETLITPVFNSRDWWL